MVLITLGTRGGPSPILYPEISSGTGRMGLGSNPPSSLQRRHINWNAAGAANGIDILYSVQGVNLTRHVILENNLLISIF